MEAIIPALCAAVLVAGLLVVLIRTMNQIDWSRS